MSQHEYTSMLTEAVTQLEISPLASWPSDTPMEWVEDLDLALTARPTGGSRPGLARYLA